jgi:hypothetical protein
MVWGMLDMCAKGYTAKDKLHHWWVLYQGKTFRGLSKGQHGKSNPDIQVGAIKQMVRFFGLNHECVAQAVPALKGRL